jgi:hypothetical protein
MSGRILFDNGAMTAQVLQFVELSDEDRKEAGRLGKLAKGDQVEVRIKRRTGGDQTLSLPPEAAALIEMLLGRLSQGERVAVLPEDQELSPSDAASILHGLWSSRCGGAQM